MLIASNSSCFGKLPTDELVCSGAGICVQTDKCECAYGSSGNQCQITTCSGISSTSPNVCSGNGACRTLDHCVCNNGYDGKQCESLLNGTILFSIGKSDYGQRGDGTTNDVVVPTPLTQYGNGIVKVQTSYYNTFITNKGGRVYGCGRNNRAQTFDGTRVDKSIFQPLDKQDFDIIDYASGTEHSLILKKGGLVFSVGRNNQGQLGLGHNSDRESPLPVIAFNGNVTQISSFDEHNLMLRNKIAYAFGRGNNGQLGQGNTQSYNTPQPIGGFTDIIMVSAGTDHSLILNENGAVYSFGRNSQGELGRGFTTPYEATPGLMAIDGFVSKISCGGLHSVVLTNDSRVFVMGENNEGQLGQGNQVDSNIPLPPVNLYSKIRNICAGDRFTLMLTENGKIYGFGQNVDGELGVGDKDRKYVPTAMLNENFNIIDMACGDQISFVIQSQHSCFGKSKSDPQLCSAKGVCIQTDVCSCGLHYTGNQCEFTTCHGKNSSDPTVCSGNGVCNDTNICVCNSGFGGKECDFTFDPMTKTMLYGTGENDYGEIGDLTKITKDVFTLGASQNFGIAKIYAGYHHSIFTKHDGSTYSFGRNDYYQLIDGSKVNDIYPKQILNDGFDIVDVAIGNEFTIVLNSAGQGFGIGRNNRGQLGDGTNSHRNYLTPIKNVNTNVTKISARLDFSMILRNNMVYTFGRNSEGQLGLGMTGNDVPTPTSIPNFNDIILIAAGHYHGLIVRSNGVGYSFGDNGSGQLGDGTTNRRTSPVLIESEFNNNIIQVAASARHSFFLRSDGKAYGFGRNGEGCLGLGMNTNKYYPEPVIFFNTKIVQIALGEDFTYLLNANGKVYSFGKGTSGELGIGERNNKNLPQLVPQDFHIIQVTAGDDYGLILRSNYTCYGKLASDATICSGNGLCIGTNICSCASNYFGDSCQYTKCFGKLSSDSSVCSGNGNCTETNVCVCFNNYDGYECEIYVSERNQKIAYSFGWNGEGELGQNTTSNPNPTPTRIAGYFPGAIDIVGGHENSAFLITKTAAYGFGKNSNWELVVGSTDRQYAPKKMEPPIFDFKVKQISLGYDWSLFLSEDERVYGVGRNTYGNLGDGTNNQRKSLALIRAATNVSFINAGFDHSAYIRLGYVYTFGRNNYGQLGLGNNNDQYQPSIVWAQNEIVDIACGGYHTLILKSNGNAFGTGFNTNGQLGIGNTQNTNTPQWIQQNGNIIKLAAGEEFSMILKSNGVVYSMGRNNVGQLGDDTLIGKNTPTLVHGPLNSRIIDISCGDYFSLMLKSNGKLYGFGDNQYGTMGIGSTYGSQRVPIAIMSERNYGIVKMSAGEHTSYILQSNSICFGVNSSDDNVCLGRGICVDEDKCQCDNQYAGNNCQYPICYGIDSSKPNVCSGRGICVSPNTCSCKTGASGNNCENYVCFGVDSKSNSVCSSFGVCEDIDICNCTLRHLGENCQYDIRKIIIIQILETRRIAPNDNTILLSKSMQFRLETETSLSPSFIQSNIECRIGNNRYQATVKSSKFVSCDLTITKDDEVSLWYAGNQTFVISSNTLRLAYFEASNISYNVLSDQFGNTHINNDILVDLNSKALPLFQSRARCSINGTSITTAIHAIDIFKCTLNLPKDSIYHVGLLFLYPNLIKIDDVFGVFEERSKLSIASKGLPKSSKVEIIMNTKSLISSGMLSGTCEDLIVTFKNQSILRQISKCGSIDSIIAFLVEDNINGISEDYDIYYSNTFHSQINSVLPGTPQQILYNITMIENSQLKLSTNSLLYRAVPRFNIIQLLPQFLIIGNQLPLTIQSNISFNNFNLLDYEISVGLTNYSAVMNVNEFKTNVTSTFPQQLSLNVFAIYKPTGKKLLLSTSSPIIYFWNYTALTSLTPYVTQYSIPTTNVKETIEIRTGSSLLSDVQLYCKLYHNGIVKYSKASKLSSNLLGCELDIHGLELNTEMVHISLVLNETLGEIKLSPQNLTKVFIKSPILHSGVPKTILSHNYLQNFTLEFSDLRNDYIVSYTNYTVAMKPEFHNSIMLNCHYESSKPKCSIPTLLFNYVPVKLNMELSIYSHYYNTYENIAIDFLYHKENVSINQEYPFIIDLESYLTKPVSILFNTTKKLNPLYSFSCIYENGASNIMLINPSSQYKCDIQPTISDRLLNVSLWLNESTSNDLGGLLSSNHVGIRFSQIRYDPKYVEINSLSIINLITTESEYLHVPLKYHSNSFHILNEDDSVKFSCSADTTNIKCQKALIDPNGPTDIYFLNFRLQTNNVDLTPISDRILIYKNNSLASISPSGALKNQLINLTLTFDLNTLHSNLSIGSAIYCKDNVSNTYWNGTVISRTQLVCQILFADHNETTLHFEVALKVPSITSVDIPLSTNFKSLYYLEPSSISFSLANQTEFEYTSTYLPVNITINTFIPQEIRNNIFCKLSDSDDEHITYFISSQGNLHFIMCNFSSTVDGRKNASIWYKDSYHKFEISSNSLELVFVTSKPIYLFSPPAVKQNRTTSLSISTFFTTEVDYGAREFYCEYGYNDTGKFVSPTFSSGGVFKCDVILLIEGKAFMKIWMKVKNILKVISKKELFNIVNSNFFEPSFGTPIGNDTLVIHDFNDPVFSVRFVKTSLQNKYNFNCHVNGTDLVCLTPTISPIDFPIYSTQDLQFINNQSISTRYILYEKRNIESYYPKVVSATQGSFLMNISLYNETTLFEGTLFVVLAKFTEQDIRYDLGQVSNLSKIAQTMSTLAGGVYPMEIFYFNPFCFEIRSMFTISQTVNVTFTGKSNIELVSNDDMFYINMNESITIKFNKVDVLHLNAIQKQSVRCKLGNEILETTVTGYDTFKCFLSSSTPKEAFVSMIYKNEDAYGDEILLSSSTVKITFVEKLTMLSMTPFATLKSMQDISLNSTLSLTYDALYKCVYGSQIADATLVGKIFKCNFNRISASAHQLNVSLNIISKGKGTSLRLSSNELVFFYMNQMKILSTTPHLGRYSSFPINFTESVNISLYSDLLTSNNVYCKLTDEHSNSIYTKLEYVSDISKQNVKCEMKKNIVSKTVTFVDIQLFMDFSSNYSFIISSNYDTYLMVPTTLNWRTERLISIDSLNTVLDFYIPDRIFNYKLDMVTDLTNDTKIDVNCTFEKNSYPNCNLPRSHFEKLKQIPLKLNFNLHVNHNYTNADEIISIEYLIYYRKIEIEHLKPYFISSVERKYKPTRFISNIKQFEFNRNFIFKCNSSTSMNSQTQTAKFNLQETEYQPGLSKESHFVCQFNSYGGKNSTYTLKLYFESELGNIDLASNSPSIYTSDSIRYSPTHGPIGGNFEISIPFNYNYPTNYTKLNFTIQLQHLGEYHHVGDCKLEIPQLNCHINSMEHLIMKTSKVKLELFMNNERSTALTPFFGLHNNFILKEILPSTFVDIEDTGVIYFNTIHQMNYHGKQMNVKYSFNGTNVAYPCTIINETSTQCPYPQFKWIGSVLVSIAQTGSVYEVFETKLATYDKNNISIESATPKSLSFIKRTEVTFYGSGFINTSFILINLYDGFVSKYFRGTYISDKIMSVNVDPLYDLNLLLPRELKMKVSFDGGLTYINNISTIFTLELPPTLEFVTKLIALNETTSGIKIKNYPHDIYLSKGTHQWVYKLTMNETYSHELECSFNNTLNCDLKSNPKVIGHYTFSMEIKDLIHGNSRKVHMFARNSLYVYKPIVASVEPKVLVLNSNEVIRVKGNWDTEIFKTVKFRFKYPTSLFSFSQDAQIVEGTVTSDEISVSIPETIQTISNIEVDFTFNEMNYHPLSFPEKIQYYTMDRILNLDGLDNNFLSESSTMARVIGTNFIDTGNDMKLILQTSKITVDITKIAKINVTSSTELYFRFPNVTEINFGYELRYPFRLPIGLSFNGGNYYTYIVVNYLNSFPQPVFSGIFPTISPRRDLNLTIFGVQLNLAVNCTVHVTDDASAKNTPIYETPLSNLDLKSNSVKCFIPKSVQVSYSKLYISMKNSQGERNSNTKEISLYDPPVLSGAVPNVAESFGGIPISIIGENIPQPFGSNGIYCKFGQIICEKECAWVSPKEVVCTAQAHPPTKEVQVYLSYNKFDWHPLASNSTKFSFSTCSAGYTAKDYRDVCHLCPPGTYKQVGGLFECTPCSENKYTLFSGSTTCDTCPANTTTGIVVGSSSFAQCVCDEGFYLNPEFNEFSGAHKKCIACPEGAVCAGLNTTEPLAKRGYWNYENNYHDFYLCKPKDACPGGGPANCTIGYKGVRCGQCINRWYKFRGECLPCESVELVWLRLLGIMGALALITGLFFALSSTKVHHIASIAIAFSFWQVLSMLARFDIKWPSLIGGSLTASSVSNFNVDFLSPNCIFPDINYITLWYLQMMMPIMFFTCFMILYSILVVRSMFAIPTHWIITRFIKIRYFKPTEREDSDDDERNDSTKKKHALVRILLNLLRILGNIGKNILNTTIWYFTERSTGRELTKIFNRIVNAYFAFLSFSFIFIMTTASEVFVCTQQPDGTFTLDSSADIICYQNTWFVMLPLTIFWYILFGGGSATYFILIFFNFKKWSNGKNFRERNKFMLSRFKKKYFFWEAVVTLRKTILSILYIFLDDMLVIVAGIILLFVGFLLHTNFVPFKRKFHNVMDYFVILVTLTTLFFGLLFFVDNFPPGTKTPAEYVSFGIIIISTLIVVSMILWDANTRRKNDKKKLKNRLKQIQMFEQHEEDTRQLLNQLHEKEEIDDMFHTTKVPWDVDYEFALFGFKTESESPEENFNTMNDIFSDLLSWKRISRKIFLAKRKGTKTTKKIIKKLKKKTKEEIELKKYLDQLKDEEDEIRRRIRKNSSVHLTRELEDKYVKSEIKKKKKEFQTTQEVERRKSEKQNSTVDFGSINLKELEEDIKMEEVKQETKEKNAKNIKKLLNAVKKLIPDEDLTEQERMKKNLEERKKNLKGKVEVKSKPTTPRTLNDSRVFDVIDIDPNYSEKNVETLDELKEKQKSEE